MSKSEFIQSTLAKYEIDDDLEYLNENAIEALYDLYANGINDETKLVEVCAYYAGLYYELVNKDVDQMIKYYTNSVNFGVINAMYRLGYFYEQQKDIDKMIMYYSMAITEGYIDAMYRLADYYESQEDLENFLKYLLMVINYDEGERENIKHKLDKYISIPEICDYLIDMYKEEKSLGNVLKEKEAKLTHLMYRPSGPGFKETQDHFVGLVSQTDSSSCEKVEEQPVSQR